MSWRKNAISYLIWFVYTAAAGSALISLCTAFCAEAGAAKYWGLAAAVLCIGAAGGIVFLLFRLASKASAFAEKKRSLLPALMVFLAVTGIVLRVRGIDGVEPVSEYYDAAKVTAGQKIPQMVHGADYLYLQILNVIFILAGNYFTAGIWLQIVLQFMAAMLMFFAVRRFAGAFPALTAFGFCMCAPYMIQCSLTLSPEMLYFGIVSLAAVLLSAGAKGRLEPVIFLFAGILAAVCTYIDITGVMLLVLAGGFLFCRRAEEADVRRKLSSVLFCLTGTALGFLCCVFMDSLLSGKTFQGIAGAWVGLYSPGEFRLPAAVGGIGSATENFVLLALLAMGIFSFWRDRQKERISLWVIAACFIMTGRCFGVFTEKMPGFYYLYLLCSVLAGIGLGQCFYADPAGDAAAALAEGERKMEEKEKDDRKADLDKTDKESHERGEEIRQEKALKEEFRQEKEKREQEKAEQKKPKFIENPLPLPKKHVKRVMDYPLRNIPEDDDFDYPVREDDDFDI